MRTPALRSRLVKIQIIQTPLMTTTQIIQTTVPWMAPCKGTDYNIHTIYILSHFRAGGGKDYSSQISAGKYSNHLLSIYSKYLSSKVIEFFIKKYIYLKLKVSHRSHIP